MTGDGSKAASATKSKHKGPVPQARGKDAHATRETVESIVIAVILAFLFRAFVAEAFVIPTGSMAPTLQGRHIDIACDACGYRYRTGASREESGFLVDHVACPNCGLHKDLERSEGWIKGNQDSFNGDRILVSKFSYDLSRPKRWDVIVFKFPGNAKQNYIKRLVGLPSELLQVSHGNVYVTPTLFTTADLSSKSTLEAGQVDAALRDAFQQHGVTLSEQPFVPPSQDLAPTTIESHGGWARRINDGEQRFLVAEHEGRLYVYRDELRILRKPPYKQLAMLQTVHDSSHVSDELHKAGWPLRWRDTDAWTTTDFGRTYDLSPSAAGVSWLRYRHLLPDEEEWRQVREGMTLDIPAEMPGELITDYYAYNFSEMREQRGLNWVPDLAVEASVESLGDSGAIHLELVRAGRRYQCRFDLSTGEAALRIDDGSPFGDDGKPHPRPVAATKVRGKGAFRLRMSNVDDEIRVWANGKLLAFDGPTTYLPTAVDAPVWSPGNPGDTEPAAVGGEGVALRVKRLRLLRDVYYVAKDFASGNSEADFPLGELYPQSPQHWSNNGTLFESRRSVYFVLGEHQFFPMGDNSPQSLDARRWSTPYKIHVPPHYVDEKLLTGKALLIYWPHAWRPFLPNFGRMGLIR